MKKIISLLLIITFAVCIFPFVSNADALPSYSVESVDCAPDDTVTVDISISGNPGIISLRFQVVFDTQVLKLESVENSALLNAYTTPSADMTSPYTLRWADSLAYTNNSSNGVVATLTFKALGVSDASQIKISHVEARNVDGTKITFADATAPVSVSDSEPVYVFADGVSTDIDAAISGFASGSVSLLTIPDGVDISGYNISAPANGEIIVNDGAIYNPAKITGASGAIISDSNTGTVYGWRSSSSSWIARNPASSVASVDCVYEGTQALINSTGAIQGNIVSKKITKVGVIFIPKSALSTSSGGLGDLNGDGDRTNADLTPFYLSSQFAVCGSMSVSIGMSGMSYYSATLLASNPSMTIVCGWYVEYQVGDAENVTVYFPSSTSSNIKPSDFSA